MRAHLIDGEFQSDKYPTTPRGKVPLSVRDPQAQPKLWEYAEEHDRDPEFRDDLKMALVNAGHVPLVHRPSTINPAFTACGLDLERFPINRNLDLSGHETCPRCKHVVDQLVAAKALVR